MGRNAFRTTFLSSPGITILLTVALAVSLAFHFVGRGGGERAPRVVAFMVAGPALRPTLLVDFDAEMVRPTDIDKRLEPGRVRLDPPVAVEAAFVTARRLRIRPLVGLPPFTAFGVVLGNAFADARGRAVDLENGRPLVFHSSVLALKEAPCTFVGENDERLCQLTFNGDLRRRMVLEHVHLEDARGATRPFTLLGKGRTWTIRPEPGKADGGIVLVVDGALSNIEGEVAGRSEHRPDTRYPLTWSTTLRITDLRVRGRGPRRRIQLRFSHALAQQDFDSFVEVTPKPADLGVEAKGTRLQIHGSFPPRSRVEIRVRQGLRSVGRFPEDRGLPLKEDVVRIVKIPPLAPDVRIADAGHTLSTAARPELGISGVNVPVVDVTLQRVHPNNVVPLALGWRGAPSLAGEAKTLHLPIDAPLDERWTRRLDLEALLGETPLGIFHVRVRDPASWGYGATRLLQITDLAPIVRVGPDRLAVLVSRISDGTAVVGAEVQAFDAKNQQVAHGTTDAQGLLVLPGTAPQVVVVRHGGDQAYVDLKTHALAHDARDIEGRGAARGLEAYVIADRGVVRPGETAHLTALVRTPHGHAPAGGLPLELRLHAPDQRVVKTWTRHADACGMLALDVPFPPDAPTGSYRVDVVAAGEAIEGDAGNATLGAVAFRVASIVPDRIEPALDVPPGDLRFGDKTKVGLSAALLTGRPAPNLRARLSIRYAPDPTPPVDGFFFGDPDAAPEPFQVDAADVRLDDAGRAQADVALPKSNASGLPLRAVFELEVVDVSGRASFVRETRRVLPRGARLGVAPPKDGSFELPLVLQGAMTAKGTAVLERLRWEGGYVWTRRGVVWRADRVSEQVASLPFEITAGRGALHFDDPGGGSYRVRVVADGVGGAVAPFERWRGRTEATLRGEGAPRLELRLKEDAVAPGAYATLEVDAPFAGRGLVTVEGPETLMAVVVDLLPGRQDLEIEMPDAPAPNVHATLTLVRGVRDADGGSVRVLGAVRVPLRRPERKLDVTLDLPPRARPGTDLVVGIETSRPATVRVHLVDEGVLRLTGYRTPDPLAFFNAPRRLDTRLADAYTQLLDPMRFLGGDDPEPGGGAGLLADRLDPTARKTIHTVALASALVACDGQPATLTFRLPDDYEGRLRVFAVAASEGATGAASAPLVLESPLPVAVHVPRAVAPGDVFDVPIGVHGEDVTLDITLDGLERLPSEDTLLCVRAGQRMGVASVVVKARDGAGHETTRRALLSVRPASPQVKRHVVRRLAAGETLDEDLPGTWMEGHRRARLLVGAPGVLDLVPALDRLLEYPHGCVEQTVAQAFPLLALSELARLAQADGGPPEDTVTAAIDRVLGMQTSDGGLALWLGQSKSTPYGSAYGAHFLLEAKQAGRRVPEAPLARLLDYLETRLRQGHVDAYTARILAQGGRAVAPFLAHLATEAEAAEEVANLAAAYLWMGEGERADAMLAKETLDPWAAPTLRGGTLDSPVRAAATLLGALVQARPDDARIPELTERLTAAAGATGPHTTQADAALLLALAKVHGAASPMPAASGTLTAGGREHPFGQGAGVVATVGPDEDKHVRLTADGPVTLVIEMEGIPLDTGSVHGLGDEPEHGIRITRRITAPDGPLRQGQVYEVVIEGQAPEGCENLLVTDVLPGGLEIEQARGRKGTLKPDRIEPRDDRVLFFRTKPLRGAFRQTYLVRAVTVGRFAVPPIRAELLYAPQVHGRSPGGKTLEIVR